ncbi:S8 family serine peptidase [Halorarius halobius]|uniref:S8 family serine peptidase n=1 Tax=Halorarius halobius TaxID=2962671 RepID=UPI0020CD49FE|nr:S8 family serine peptidase [Halorarius halobius]
MTDDTNDDVSRRSFMKGVGVAAGAAALGASATGSGAAHEGTFHTEFANPRVREAAKVWASKPWREGFRGSPERTLAINDSGIDVDHPDLGPWNGVTAIGSGDGGKPTVKLASPDDLATWRDSRRMVGDEKRQTAVLGPGTTVEGSDTPFPAFTVPTREQLQQRDDIDPLPDGKGVVDMDATLSWTPQNVPLPSATPVLSSAGEDQSFRAEVKIDGQWITLKTVDTGSNPETLTNITAIPGKEHRFVAGQFANVVAQGEVTYSFHTYDDDLDTLDGSVEFTGDGSGPAPKTVGWFDSGSRYGSHLEPEDPDSHGSHVSGITGGSGRASTVETLQQESPRTVLTAGDVLSYEVEADAGTGVFGVATGEGIEVLVEGPDGRTLRVSGNVPPLEEARVDHPTVDDRHDGTETYTVIVRPLEGEAASTGRVNEVVVGAFADPETAPGDRTDGEVSLHSGVAPDASLMGIQGLSGPVASLALYGDELVPTFNLRAMNSSWGGLVPGGGTVGGSSLEAAVKRIAESGVLLVAAAGNNFGTINTAPAIADEAVSVAAVDDLDGITGYTDGGAQAQDEDSQGAYGKPDVCAPGGTLVTGARAVRAESDGVPAGTEGVRDYTNKAGTSMASPYTTGAVGLIAQAMEEGAPDSIRLPSPSNLHANHTASERLEHVLRLKQTLLATASSTAFTAAPYHKHAVTYRHDGRDTYEGYGRINPDAAVDALTRDLFAGADPANDPSVTVSGEVGLDVPDDSRAVAGHVEVPAGTLEVSVDHSHYSGGNKGLAKDVPWLDLFVYDAETPGRAGTPNTLASAQGQQGSASVSVDVSAERDDPTTGADESETRTLFVVAKLVNVPGVVNGYDVQSQFDLDVSFTAAGALPKPSFAVEGSRSDDGSVFTAGQTNQVDVTVDGINEEVPDGATVRLFDTSPWELNEFDGGDATKRTDDGTVHLGTTTAGAIRDGGVTKSYFVDAPASTGRYTFGAGSVELVTDVPDVQGSSSPVGGTDTNTVVGASTNPGEATSDATDL